MCESTVSDESIDADDLLEDPRTDAEALCLCGLLWAPRRRPDRWWPCSPRPTSTGRSTGSCSRRSPPTSGPAHSMTRPASPRTSPKPGRPAGRHGTQLSRALSEATTAGAGPEAAGHYARAVVAAAYRRGFYAAGAAITQAAAELPQDQLFEHLLSIGRERRTATDRLDRTLTALN